MWRHFPRIFSKAEARLELRMWDRLHARERDYVVRRFAFEAGVQRLFKCWSAKGSSGHTGVVRFKSRCVLEVVGWRSWYYGWESWYYGWWRLDWMHFYLLADTRCDARGRLA